MTVNRLSRPVVTVACALFVVACGGAPPPPVEEPPAQPEPEPPEAPKAPEKEAPPASAAPRDIKFPPLAKDKLDNGLGLDVVTSDALPTVQLQLVIQSGSASDPEKMPGLAALVGDMLKEGTKKRSAAQLAEQVEFLGAELNVYTGRETTYLSMRALSEHMEAALELLADAALNPAFRPRELDKLKRRELNRLKLSRNEAKYVARREFNAALYGDHPYARTDTTEAALKRIKRGDLMKWHKAHMVPNNAFLVVVGDARAAQVKELAGKVFKRWKTRKVKEETYAAPPARTKREVLVVDRPDSVQSVIYIGHLGLKRANKDFIPLRVANQVLGGSAASRLFMDLREKRSLTYGAYSRVGESVDVGIFRAAASVRNEVTGEAVGAFFEHLERITNEPVPETELADAHRYLGDSFPLKIETAARVADLVADLRIFGLPDGYWDSYRSQIRGVSVAQAHEAAKAHIHPDKALVLVVGKAADVVPALRAYGPVRVIDTDGKPVTAFDAKAKSTDAKSDTKARPEAKAKPEAAKPAAAN